MHTLERLTGFCLAIALTLTLAGNASAQFDGSRNAVFLSHVDEYTGPICPNNWKYSSCWSYVHHDGREYAVIGACNVCYIYNITVPTAPVRVATIPVPIHTHHKMRSYKEYVYIVTDGVGTWPNSGPPPGIQIIDMSKPDQPVLLSTWTGSFNTTHTVTLDENRGLLYCNGTRLNGVQTGLRILSLEDPKNPVELGTWPPNQNPMPLNEYIHETDPRKDIAYAASMKYPNGGTGPGESTMRILDVSDPSHPKQISNWTYPGARTTHSSWTDKSNRYLYVCDEAPGQPMRVFDQYQKSIPPPIVAEYRPIPQPGSNDHVVHNPRVVGHEMMVPSYIEGVRFLDLEDPAHPAEYGWIDTYPGNSPRWFYGVWEACPYYPSGNVIASDMQNGLWVFRPDRNYGTIRVTVNDFATGQPLAGANVKVTTQGDLLTTRADGIVRFGPSPGTHVVEVSKSGYVTQMHEREVVRDNEVSLVVVLRTSLGGGGGNGPPGPKEFAQILDEASSRKIETKSGRPLAIRLANPTRGEARITIDVPDAGELDANIVDVNGRRLFQLYEGGVFAGDLRLSWSGHDNDGRAMPPGVYFVQANLGSLSTKSRIVWLK